MIKRLFVRIFTLTLLLHLVTPFIFADHIDDFNAKNYKSYLTQLDEDLAGITGRRPQILSLCRAVIAINKTDQDLKPVINRLNNDQDLVSFANNFYQLLEQDISVLNAIMSSRYVYANTIPQIISLCKEHDYSFVTLCILTKFGSSYLEQVNALLSINKNIRYDIERDFIESNSKNLRLMNSLINIIALEHGELPFSAREYMDLALKIDDGKMSLTSITNVDLLYKNNKLDLAKELLLMNAYYNEEKPQAYNTAMFHYTQRFGDRDAFINDLNALKKELAAKKANEIMMVAGDYLNLKIDMVTQTAIVLKQTSKSRNYFAGKFANIPINKEVIIRIDMPEDATTMLWNGLNPVYTYGDINKYETYETFSKGKDGVWRSNDIFKLKEEKDAGKGMVPIQNIVKEEAAAEFLSADGNYWSAFQNITKTSEGANRFSLTHTFTQPEVTISMRVPFTDGFLEEYLDGILALDRDDIVARHIGFSTAGNELYAIEVGLDGNHKKPVIVLYGGEDGDEYDSIWAAVGAANWLISTKEGSQLLDRIAVVIIPTLDPDGGINCSYGSLADAYQVLDVRGHAPTEVISFTKYIRDLIADGYTVSSMTALHNVECTEAPNFLCPVYDLRDSAKSEELHKYINDRLPDTYMKSEEHWMTSFPDKRFNGWASQLFGSTFAAYEVNGRYPARVLNLDELQGLGGHILSAICEYTIYDVDKTRHLKERQAEWRAGFMEYLESLVCHEDDEGEEEHIHYYLSPYLLLNKGY